MPGLKLYADLRSQPSRATYLLLKMNGVPFEFKETDLAKREHQTEEYTKICPFQQVPAIDDNGFTLTESVAILKYLCAEYSSKIPSHWYPTGNKERARIDEYMAWQHSTVRKHGVGFFVNKVYLPSVNNGAINQKAVDEAEAGLNKALNFLETVFLKDHDYIGGDDISIADLLAICEIHQPTVGGFNPGKDRTKVAAWIERVKARLAAHYGEATAAIDQFATNA